MTPSASLCLLVLALAAPGVRADPTYVIEQLVVSVSSTSDAESERVGQVKSGDKLEVIEREGDATHVKLSNGKDGWIKSAYLTSDPPLQTRLTERTADAIWSGTARSSPARSKAATSPSGASARESSHPTCPVFPMSRIFTGTLRRPPVAPPLHPWVRAGARPKAAMRS